MKPIRVLVVDDSATMRQLILDLLAQDDGIEIVAQAANGLEALHLAAKFNPDLITMDLEMPELGGMQAIEILMSTRPVPILVLSDQVSAQSAMAAVAMGALEVLDKSPEVLSQNLCRRVRLLAGVPVVRHIRAGLNFEERLGGAAPQEEIQDKGISGALIGIASSTGGPQALEMLMRALPADFPAPILIAQHMAEGFSQGLVDWLNSLSPLDICLAESGQRPAPGQVFIAPSEYHLIIETSGQLTLLKPEARDIYHPSCDCLLGSLARVAGRKAIGIILTGMGRDGVRGIADIKAAGGLTLAQDEATSVIFGMNRLAIESGQVDKVLPITDMAREMQLLASTR